MKQTIRFLSGLIVMYVVTIGAVGYALYPAPIFVATSPVVKAKPLAQTQSAKASQPKPTLTSGKPVRVTIPDYGIDLPVDDGRYNESDGTWTLSNTHAQYAVMTTPANNISGNTLIYGHNNDVVFGKLGAKTPAVDTVAKVYTNNNHVFTYKFTDARNLAPNDLSVLTEGGTPATLTIQTCTGVFSQWRTMFRFQFQEMS